MVYSDREQMASECISSCDPFTGESILVINERFETLKYDLRFLHHLVSNLLFPIGRKKLSYVCLNTKFQ